MTTLDTRTPPDAVTTRRPAGVRLLWVLLSVLALAAVMVASVAFGSR
ncbi:iron ABC transporter permease, partial [Streptomyces sp. SID7982]|nr:iron ABC transporter permease [Streptomyces sp. SID7982]